MAKNGIPFLPSRRNGQKFRSNRILENLKI